MPTNQSQTVKQLNSTNVYTTQQSGTSTQKQHATLRVVMVRVSQSRARRPRIKSSPNPHQNQIIAVATYKISRSFQNWPPESTPRTKRKYNPPMMNILRAQHLAHTQPRLSDDKLHAPPRLLAVATLPATPPQQEMECTSLKRCWAPITAHSCSKIQQSIHECCGPFDAAALSVCGISDRSTTQCSWLSMNKQRLHIPTTPNNLCAPRHLWQHTHTAMAWFGYTQQTSRDGPYMHCQQDIRWQHACVSHSVPHA